MRLYFIGICAHLFFLIFLVCAKDGKYSVSIAFSQNVPLEKGMDIIDQMKESFQSASKILHNAIGMQFGKVMVEVPESWTISGWNETVEDSLNSYSTKADVLIDNTVDTVFGKFPFAQQYGSCGISGHQIIIPTVFFDELNSFPKGLSIAREWLKYRYGVFDENGYAEDPSYPLYYHIPGSNDNKVHFTDCTNIKIEYNFTDQNGNECPSDRMLIHKLESKECGYRINENFKENVISSFMYFDENISSMTHICGEEEHPHNSRSPNKQNVLCYGKSIWDILLTHNDFREGKMKTKYQDVEFGFFKKIKPRVVVAWENTEKMKEKGEIILNAVGKLMIDLPDGSKFSAFPFTDTLEKDHPLVDLNDENNRKNVILGISSTFVKPTDGNYTNAIKKALKILKTPEDAKTKDVPPGNIIIITGTSKELIVILLKDFNVCFDTLSSIKDDISENEDELTSKLPCLEVVRLPMDDAPEDTFRKLTEILGKFCPSKVEDKFTETLKIEYLEDGTALSVAVDEWTETVTFWIFRQLDSENFLLNEGQKTLKEDVTYGHFRKLSYTTILYKPGVLEFKYKYSMKSSLVAVEKTSKAGHYITGEVIVKDTTNEDNFQMPVIIYVIVRFGSYPVQNANVSATIKHPGGEETYLVLNDDGKGDPDITKNDGVYSRYFTNFTDEGEYTVTVSVSNNDKTSSYGVDENAGYKSCCGSLVNGNTPKLSQFAKVFEGKFTAKSGRPEGGYKPSRITDLKVGKVEEDGITLTWTAPGAEADSDGTASRYEIKLFCDEENPTKCDILKAIQVANIPLPLNYGEEQSLTIKIEDKTLMLSIAIVAFNEHNKTSDLSNIVQIFRPSGTLPEIVTEDPEVKKAKFSKIGTIVGWVIAGILIIICILGVVVYLRRKEDKKPRVTEENSDNQKTKPTFEATDISIKKSSVKKIESFPVLLYTHDQIKDCKSKENDIPLYKSNVPPKQWKSSDVIYNLRKEDDRDTKSLESSSTINLEEDGNKIRTLNDKY